MQGEEDTPMKPGAGTPGGIGPGTGIPGDGLGAETPSGAESGAETPDSEGTRRNPGARTPGTPTRRERGYAEHHAEATSEEEPLLSVMDPAAGKETAKGGDKDTVPTPCGLCTLLQRCAMVGGLFMYMFLFILY